ncbi:hypothetical protein [Rhizobium sullae]|uniref:hypothetical protein n=1 Tax=Rhizobium sullae TaxID=50338 RepID=UPI001AECAFC4|nr:hypothetical protein [Rhizobium sullae]
MMDLHGAALIAAGVIGGGTAVPHGILLQRLVVSRVDASLTAAATPSAPMRRLIPLLLHFTTFNWLLSGVALIAAVIWYGREAQLAASFFAGSSFLFGALGALWGVRRLHPGWVLMAVAFALIVWANMPAIGSAN